MNSAIAILTYRRVGSLRTLLSQVTEHCRGVPIAVFEDCGQIDNTEEFLVRGATFLRRDWAYEADVYERDFNGAKILIFMSHENAGVAGNSNKAIRWFMTETTADHLCLCNDDLEVTGGFHQSYAVAHEKLNVGLLCFCDFAEETYKWATVKAKGLQVKLLSRMTGIMMSMTRELVNQIGYYDAYNFTFGQEHCDYTNRARLTGYLNLNGVPQHCLDVVCPELKHQEVESSLTEAEKTRYNADADLMIDVIGGRRASSDAFVGYSTGRCSRVAGARDGVGIPAHTLRYTRIKESRLEGASPLRFLGEPVVFTPPPAPIDLGTDETPSQPIEDIRVFG